MPVTNLEVNGVELALWNRFHSSISCYINEASREGEQHVTVSLSTPKKGRILKREKSM